MEGEEDVTWTHFGSVAVVERVFYHQPLEHLDGDLTDLSELLKSPAHLPQQQAHQEVVPTEVVRQRIVQLKIWMRRRYKHKTSKRKKLKLNESTELEFSHLGNVVFDLSRRAWGGSEGCSAHGCRQPAGTQT